MDGETVTYERTDYLYDEAWQAIEERRDSFEVLGGEGGALETPAEVPGVQWLWDIRYVDSPVLRWRDADLDSETGYLGLEETLYACNDANMNVTALIDAATGEAVERYVYDPYGKATFYDGQWQPTEVEDYEDGAASVYASDILYCGYRFDSETGLDQVRYRYYHPTLGRWTSRDPMYASDGSALYAYVGGKPSDYVDPWGLVEVTISEEPNDWVLDARSPYLGLTSVDPAWFNVTATRQDATGNCYTCVYTVTAVVKIAIRSSLPTEQQVVDSATFHNFRKKIGWLKGATKTEGDMYTNSKAVRENVVTRESVVAHENVHYAQISGAIRTAWAPFKNPTDHDGEHRKTIDEADQRACDEKAAKFLAQWRTAFGKAWSSIAPGDRQTQLAKVEKPAYTVSAQMLEKTARLIDRKASEKGKARVKW